MKNRNHLRISLILSIVSAASANAALTLVEQFNPGNTPPSPISALSNDLLQTSVSGVTGEMLSQNLRNGSTGSAHDDTPTDPASINFNSSYTTVYDLDITSNTLGYDITEFRLFSGWLDGRASQQYVISYSLVGSGDFTVLTDVTSIWNNGSLLTRVFDSTTGPLITGVDAIRFEFLHPNGDSNLGTVYREIDVIGVASIPEPSLCLLGGLSLTALAFRRRIRAGGL